MGAFKYVLMLLLLGGAMYVGSQLLHHHIDEKGDLSLTEIPANMLIYAKEDVKKTYYSTALEHVAVAITTMRQTQVILDAESQVFIDEAIDDLNKVERTLTTGFVFEDELNMSFARALNSLAYAYMRVSEDALAEDKQTEALSALSIAVMQLDYSMRFATDSLFEDESIIMMSLSEMLEDKRLEIEQLHPLTEDLKVLVSSGSATSE